MGSLLKFKTSAFLTLLVVLVLSAGKLTADTPDPVEEYWAFYEMNLDDEGNEAPGVFLQWFHDDDPEAVGFRFYLSDNNENFELNADITDFKRDSVWGGRGMAGMTFLPMTLNEGIYYCYMTAYNNDGESDRSPVMMFEVRNWNNDFYYLIINNYPVDNATINSNYTFTPDIEIVPELDDVRYSFELEEAPEDMVIDQTTGEINWTPRESGMVWFSFNVEAYDADNNYLTSQYFSFNIYVFTCETPATVNLTVNDSNGDPIEYGYAVMFKADSLDYGGEQGAWGEIENGSVTLRVDEGDYYLMIESAVDMGGMILRRAVFYENAQTIEDATIISVDCDETRNITMTLDADMDYDNYTVSGSVTLEDGTPVPYAFVEFQSNPYDRNSTYGEIMKSVTTDEDGNYSVILPDLFTYFAAAHHPGFKYQSVFWDQKSDPLEADSLVITGDLTGINFIFTEEIRDPDDDSTGNGEWFDIAGTVVNSDEEGLANAFVIAFLVDNMGNDDNEMYEAQAVVTNSNGEFNYDYLFPGSYVFFAFPASSDYAPGFYKENDYAVWTWDEATRVEIGRENVDDITIMLQNIEDIPGFGSVGGIVRSSGQGGTIGETLSGVSIYLLDKNGNVAKYNKSTGSGNYNLENIKEGGYSLVADKVGYKKFVQSIDLQNNKPLNENIVLQPEGATDVHDVPNPAEISVWPNPVSENINMTFKASDGISKVSLINSKGAEVFKTNVNTIGGQNSHTIDVANFASGVYFVKISNNLGISITPVVINH